jgi:hypothetical protein
MPQVSASPPLELVITGCGRSGTGFMASLLNASGIRTGHEDIYTAFGRRENTQGLQAESSWFAVPHLGELAPGTRIIHIVRNPRRVFDSFSRLGMFSDSTWHHFSRGMPALEFLVRFNINIARYRRRLAYVRACQAFVRDHTSSFDIPDEAGRIWQYWLQWNRMAGRNIAARGGAALRLRLEDAESRLPELEAFTGRRLANAAQVQRNEKTHYAARQLADTRMPDGVRELAMSYGYTPDELA